MGAFLLTGWFILSIFVINKSGDRKSLWKKGF